MGCSTGYQGSGGYGKRTALLCSVQCGGAEEDREERTASPRTGWIGSFQFGLLPDAGELRKKPEKREKPTTEKGGEGSCREEIRQDRPADPEAAGMVQAKAQAELRVKEPGGKPAVREVGVSLTG